MECRHPKWILFSIVILAFITQASLAATQLPPTLPESSDQATHVEPIQAPPMITASTNATIRLGGYPIEESAMPTGTISPDNESLIESGMNNSTSPELSSGKHQGIVDIAGNLISKILTLFW